MSIELLLGKTVKEIREDGSEIRFFTTDGHEYLMWHNQDGCESVSIEDITGICQIS